ncbi:uncharacterized protein LOC129775973 isoform X2 [Toxorhynchites rutilus septentrionalis]|uniref:uncharacterized protein LOC129775973 isoform X2 n=1 Tax=Toxorhynchites rutilus septentrionalis TaxID=329112 RepID=UPI00247943F5|nr:uncharacterized protein LOC129775973 isoform X2 [Toxorhynchites rutilus septentrionalis]
MKQLFGLICCVISLSPIIPSQICSLHRDRIKHRFYALRHCQRSNQTVIGLANFRSARDCAKYARQKHGLAFNFAPKSRNHTNWYDVGKTSRTKAEVLPRDPNTSADPKEFYNCEILECPEFQNMSSIVNDTRFDYYSLYTRTLPSGNATCVGSVGMFILEDRKLNYSLAQNECSSKGGSLAHVASETRTNMLSKLFACNNTLKNTTNAIEEVYVGLSEAQGNKFFTSANEPLECFLYRAWAPGHPRKSHQSRCITLTNLNMWTISKCNVPRRFVCELHTSGPPRNVANLRRKCSVNRPNNLIVFGRRFNV